MAGGFFVSRSWHGLLVLRLAREEQRAKAGMIGVEGGAFGTEFLGGLLREGSSDAAAVLIVVEHHFIDRPQLAASLVGNPSVTVFARDIHGGDERNVLPQVI